MHLNNQELLNLSQENLQHIDSCDYCRKRSQNLSAIRNKLISQDLMIKPSNNWHKIKRDYIEQTSPKAPKNEDKTSWWQINGWALAASVMVITFLFNTNLVPSIRTISIENKLAHIIIKSEKLQDELLKNSVQTTNKSYQNIKFQLSIAVVDHKLEQAYLNRDTDNKKLIIWKRKYLLLQQYLQRNHSKNTIKV